MQQKIELPQSFDVSLALLPTNSDPRQAGRLMMNCEHHLVANVVYLEQERPVRLLPSAEPYISGKL